MSAGIELQELYTRLSIRPDRASFAAGRREVSSMASAAKTAGGEASGALSQIGSTLKTAFAFDVYGAIKRVAVAVGGLFVDGLRYNASLEESTNKVAGMLALAGNTRFSDEIGNANDLMAELSERASKLPGTTAEYVSMLGNITQPAIAAGLKMDQLTDLTVGAVVAAKALGEEAGAAARDIGQALRGQAGADDPFIGKLLATKGFVGEQGRKKFNSSSASRRAEIVKELLTSPQLTEMAAAQGATMGGMLSTIQDTVSRFFGASTKGVFDGAKSALASINGWVERHGEVIARVTGAINRGLTAAFGAVRAVVVAVGDLAQAAGRRVVAFVGQAFGSTEAAGAKLQSFGATLVSLWEGVAARLRVAVAILGLVWRVVSTVVAVAVRLAGVLSSVASRLFGIKSGVGGLADEFSEAGSTVDRVADLVNKTADAVSSVGVALLWVVDQVQAAVDIVSPVLSKLSWLPPIKIASWLLQDKGGGAGAATPPLPASNPWDNAVDAQLGAARVVGAGAGSSTTTITNAPVINVNSTAPAPEVAREVERVLSSKLRQAGAAVPR